MNEIEGEGTMIFDNGSSYKGHCINGMMEGEGVYKWKDGRVYMGHYKNNLINGFGTYSWPYGQKYVGEFMNGKYHGRGSFTSEGKTREGVWENNKIIKLYKNSQRSQNTSNRLD